MRVTFIEIADRKMSQRDKISSRRDKITDILLEYGALFSAQITRVFNKKYATRYNKKTIERDIVELRKDGKVVSNPTVGREQTYSASRKPPPMSQFFINQFWKELDTIRHENVGDSLIAFIELRSLIKTLPPTQKDKLIPNVQKVDQQIRETKVNPTLPTSYHNLLAQQQTREKRKQVAFGLVEALIEEVSTVLHEEFGRMQKEKSKKK